MGVVDGVVDANHEPPAVVVSGVTGQRRSCRNVASLVVLLASPDVGVCEDHRLDRLHLEGQEAWFDILQHGVNGVQGCSESIRELVAGVGRGIVAAGVQLAWVRNELARQAACCRWREGVLLERVACAAFSADVKVDSLYDVPVGRVTP